jgi:inhibitor of the pro-sigma K processing machinery
MWFLLLSGIAGGVASEAVLFAMIIAVLLIVFLIGKFILKILGGLIINAILGVISLFALNSLFGLGITITPIIILAAAIFGLPGMVVIIILHFLGIVA